MNRWLCGILASWFALAVLAGALGVVATLMPPWPQLVLIALVAVLIAVYCVLPPVRRAITSLPLDFLVAIHITRLVGIYFLILYIADRLPFAFAVPGGIGDIVVAAAASILVLLRLSARPAPQPLYAVWNAVGLIDILFVVATAARLALADPDSMAELLHLPLSLLPTFLVPIIIFSHVVIAHRLFTAWRIRRSAA